MFSKQYDYKYLVSVLKRAGVLEGESLIKPTFEIMYVTGKLSINPEHNLSTDLVRIRKQINAICDFLSIELANEPERLVAKKKRKGG